MPQPTLPATRRHDPTARIAALYPHDLAAAQALLAAEAARVLRAAGRPAGPGLYGEHATCETPVPAGTLLLVPMAALWDLDAALAAETHDDPAVWHLLVRTPGGGYVSDPAPLHGCPSVLWAARAGIDPACAAGLVETALADPALGLLLGGRG